MTTEYVNLEWPTGRPRLNVKLPEGYHFYPYPATGEERFLELLVLSGFNPWEAEKLRVWKLKVIPGGWFAVMRDAQIVAACAALHENDWKPYTSEISFLVRDPAHAGKAIGRAVFVMAMNFALDCSYQHILLRTDRPNAIAIYREWGFVDA